MIGLYVFKGWMVYLPYSKSCSSGASTSIGLQAEMLSFRELAQSFNHRLAGNPNDTAEWLVELKNQKNSSRNGDC
jgi:hypothetical protein